MRARWTDLAMEARGSVPVSDVRLESGIERTVVRIEDEQTARELGRPQGTYVTLSCPQTMTIELSMREALSRELAQATAREEVRLTGRGRILLRASGTEPLIRVMAEADTQDLAESVVKTLVEAVENVQKILKK